MSSKILSNEFKRLFGAVLMMVAGSALFLVLPIYVGAAATTHGFNDELLGYLVFMEFSGAAAMSICFFFLIKKINLMYISLIGLLSIAVINSISLFVSDYSWMMVVRFLAGAAAGSIIALSLAYLSSSKNVERAFAITIAVEVVFQIIVMSFMSGVIEGFGVSVLFLLMASLSAVLLPIVYFWMPGSITHTLADANQTRVDDKESVPLLAPLTALLATSVYWLFIGGYWGFVERIGDASGLSAGFVGDCLSIGLLVGIGGAIFASYLGGRFGTVKPIALAGIVQAGAVIALLSGVNETTFLVSSVLFSFGWNFILPYQMAAVSNVDIAGRFVVTIVAFQTFGQAFGAALGGGLSESAGYAAMISVMLGFLLCGISLFMVVPRLFVHWQNSFRIKVGESECV